MDIQRKFTKFNSDNTEKLSMIYIPPIDYTDYAWRLSKGTWLQGQPIAGYEQVFGL